MAHEYTNFISWDDEEKKHGSISMDCGFSCDFHKPVEFGGEEGLMNPEDAFVGSLAMCYSITFRSTVEKMRLDISDFQLETEGLLEEVDGESMISKIFVRPRFKISEEKKDKVERALELAKENCLISKSIKSEVILKPEIEFEEE